MVRQSCETNNLRPLWDALLEVFQAYVQVCKKHGLRYSLAYGSALGAIRHGGFIPWDDDLDVQMPRPDYEKFLALAPRELPEWFKVVNWRNTPEFPLVYSKIQDTREGHVLAVEKAVGYKLSGGVFIDIFPIDGAPEDKNWNRWWKLRFKVSSLIMQYRDRDGMRLDLHGMKRMICALFYFLCPIWRNRREIISKFEALIRTFPYESSRITGSTTTIPYFEFEFSRSIWDPCREVPFEKTMAFVPHDVDAYLKIKFGDYMRLPPEEKRVTRHSYSYRCPWWLGSTRN